MKISRPFICMLLAMLTWSSVSSASPVENAPSNDRSERKASSFSKFGQDVSPSRYIEVLNTASVSQAEIDNLIATLQAEMPAKEIDELNAALRSEDYKEKIHRTIKITGLSVAGFLMLPQISDKLNSTYKDEDYMAALSSYLNSAVGEDALLRSISRFILADVIDEASKYVKDNSPEEVARFKSGINYLRDHLG